MLHINEIDILMKKWTAITDERKEAYQALINAGICKSKYDINLDELVEKLLSQIEELNKMEVDVIRELFTKYGDEVGRSLMMGNKEKESE